MSRPPRFDRIAVVDWSANASPKTGRDSIWMAVVEGDRCALSNPSTRCAALDEIAELARPGEQTLLGVDFSLGFPSGTAERCGLGGVPWAAMWAELGASIIDRDDNDNNRFEVAAQLNRSMAVGAAPADATPGPFWGCPPSRAGASLTPTKPTRVVDWPDEWRTVEHRLRSDGRRPFSCWQLLGAGAVGGQSLVGIAALERLRLRLGTRLAVWPFDTGLDVPGTADLVVAEVWPSFWEVTVPVGMVKDAAQVESTARRLAALDAGGGLAPLFRPALAPPVASVVVGEEGWVLGVEGDGG